MCLVRYLLIVMMQGILSPFCRITDAAAGLIDSCTNCVCSMMLHLDQFLLSNNFLFQHKDFKPSFLSSCSYQKIISRIDIDCIN